MTKRLRTKLRTRTSRKCRIIASLILPQYVRFLSPPPCLHCAGKTRHPYPLQSCKAPKYQAAERSCAPEAQSSPVRQPLSSESVVLCPQCLYICMLRYTSAVRFDLSFARTAAPRAPAYLPSGIARTVLPILFERSPAKNSLLLRPPVIITVS